MKSGLGALIQCGAWLAQTLDLEPLYIGRRALDREDTWTLELAGHLLYVIRLDGGWVFLYAGSMDKGDDPEFLFSVGDANWEGWKQIARTMMALERSGITTLERRPLELGEGPNSIVIG
jgi:hypothetical protein